MILDGFIERKVLVLGKKKVYLKRQRGRVVRALGLHAAAPGLNPVLTSG